MPSEDRQTYSSRLRPTDMFIGASLVAVLGGLMWVDGGADDRSRAQQSKPGLLSEA